MSADAEATGREYSRSDPDRISYFDGRQSHPRTSGVNSHGPDRLYDVYQLGVKRHSNGTGLNGRWAPPAPTSLNGFLTQAPRRIGAGRLHHGRLSAVRDRIDRLSVEDDPKALAAALRRSINALGRSNDVISYGRSFDFGRDLQHIVDTIRERLFPRDPDLAFELADAFLRSDERIFESVDDSAGAVGDVFRDACKLWLQTAAKSTLKRDRVSVFKDRIGKNGYGSRDQLLPNAAILFSDTTLREMAAEYLGEAERPRPENDRLSYDALSAASNALIVGP